MSSYLEEIVRKFLSYYIEGFDPVFNERPDFLMNKITGRNFELDIWYKELGLAFEVQGISHLTEKTKQRDWYKKETCQNNAINLISVDVMRYSSRERRVKRRTSGYKQSFYKDDHALNHLRRLILNYFLFQRNWLGHKVGFEKVDNIISKLKLPTPRDIMNQFYKWNPKENKLGKMIKYEIKMDEAIRKQKDERERIKRVRLAKVVSLMEMVKYQRGSN